MLVSGKHLTGTKVITKLDGKTIARVNDIIYDPYQNRILALVLNWGGIFSSGKYLPYENIQSIGQDAVLINSSFDVKKTNQIAPSLVDMAKDERTLRGTKIVTETGNQLGTVTDYFFDSDTGEVKQLELSQGGFSNFQSGKKNIKISSIVTVGKDTTIVKEETAQQLTNQAQTQGLQGAFNKMNAKVEQTLDDLRERINTSSHLNHDQQNEYFDRSNLAEDLQHPLTPNDSFEPSETPPTPVLTQDHTLPPTSQPEFEDEVWSEKNEKPDIKSDIKEFKDRANEKINQYQTIAYNQISKVKQDRMIRKRKDALGLFLTKTILTPDDQVLAERGQIITNKLLTDAEKHGILDQVIKNTSYDPIEK